MGQRSNRLSIILALRDQVGLSRLAQLEAESVRHRPIPVRLLSKLTEDDRQLSSREREIMVLLASGLTTQEIADELGVGFETVKTHLKRIYLRLGVHNRVEAINAFLEWEA